MKRHPLLLPVLLLCAGAARSALPAADAHAQWRQLAAEVRSEVAAGDQLQAERTAREALALSSSFPAGAGEHAASMVLLAEVLQAAGQGAGAEDSYRSALAAFAATADGGGAAAVACGQGLARLQASSGRLAEAEAQLRRTLALGEARPGPHHGGCALTVAMLADLQAAQGRPGEAAQLYQRALKDWSAPGADPDGNAATAHLGLAQLARTRGDDVQARTHLEQARAIIESTQGGDAPALIIVLSGIAAIQARADELAGAEAALLRALAICEKPTPWAATPAPPRCSKTLAGIHAAQRRCRACARRTRARHRHPQGPSRR